VVGQVHSWKLRGVVNSHSFAFSASRRLNFSYKSIENACTAFPSTLLSMLELSPPLPVLLLLRVGGLSRLILRAIPHRKHNRPTHPQWVFLPWGRSLGSTPTRNNRYNYTSTFLFRLLCDRMPMYNIRYNYSCGLLFSSRDKGREKTFFNEW
jgi:hypothetical protein